MLRRYKLKNYNFRLVILLIAISIIGVLLIGSADSADQKKQAIGVVLGVVIMIIVSLLDYSWLLNFYWVLYIGCLAFFISAVLPQKTRLVRPVGFRSEAFSFSRPSCQKSF